MSHDEIFEWYLADACPCCHDLVESDDFYAHTESGGKCMAKYFNCRNCGSEYTIGLNRSSMPILSEITINNHKEK